MIKVAVVILNWNGEKMLQQFLPSVIQNTPDHMAKIVVADNGSNDNSLEILSHKFPMVETLALDKNYGFAEGYNKALKQVIAEYYVLLNSDVEVPPKWLEPLIDFLNKNKDTSIVQPKIKSYMQKDEFEYAGACGGFIDKYGFPFCRGRILSTVEKDHGQYDSVRSLMWAAGACFVIRANEYHAQNGFDGHFFAHMEEIDLCWRIKNKGSDIKIVPSSEVYHLGGGTLPNNSPRKLFLNYRNNLLLLYKNLPIGKVFPTLTKRFAFDFTSSILYLLQGKIAFTGQVFKAWYAFFRSIAAYKPIRKHLRQNDVKTYHNEIYQSSIIAQYFIKKAKRFSQLNDFKIS